VDGRLRTAPVRRRTLKYVLTLDDGQTKTAIDHTIRISCDGELRAALVGDLIRRVAGHHRRRVVGVWPHVPGAEELNVRAADQLQAQGPEAAGRLQPDIHITTGACVLAPYDGLDPLAVRLALLQWHYRTDVSLTREDLEAAATALTARRQSVAQWAENPGKAPDSAYVAEAIAALDDDLDTPKTFKILNRLAEDPRVPPGAKFETVIKLDMILGLDLVALVGRI
jgi:hypothetical protein